MAPPWLWWTAETAGTPAGVAAAVELHAVGEHLEPGAQRQTGPNTPNVPGRHVVDSSARHAGEVVVGRGVAIETHAREIGPFVQQALGGEHTEVAVDGGQAHAGQPPSHLAIDGSDAGVRVAGTHGLEDHAPSTREPLAARVERRDGSILAGTIPGNHSQLERRPDSTGAARGCQMSRSSRRRRPAPGDVR